MNMGRALCKIATLQETFAMSFEDSFLAGIHRAEDEIKEYQLQRKKLDSRRCVHLCLWLGMTYVLGLIG